MLNKNNCLLCGEELSYFDEAKSLECSYCHQTFESNASCEIGHYVCDNCHSKDGFEIIKDACLSNQDNSPLDLAISIMKHPAIKMHGPEHHFLVPAVLLSCYYNTINQRELLPKKIEQAEKRAKNVLGGFCGFYGNCGAAVGTGIFMSVVNNTKPVSTENWGDAHRMTAKCLLDIADAEGPRCCKRDTFISIRNACDFIEEKLGVALLQYAPVRCDFSHLNKECKTTRCQFYKLELIPLDQ